MIYDVRFCDMVSLFSFAGGGMGNDYYAGLICGSQEEVTSSCFFFPSSVCFVVVICTRSSVLPVPPTTSPLDQKLPEEGVSGENKDRDVEMFLLILFFLLKDEKKNIRPQTEKNNSK